MGCISCYKKQTHPTVHYMKKQIVCFLLLLPALAALHAQHTYRADSLGVSISFPCIPEDLDKEELSGGLKLNGAKCQASPGELYMFAYANVNVPPANAEVVRLYLKSAETGLTGEIKARVTREKMKLNSSNQGWLQYHFKSKSTGLSGFGLIICNQNLMYQLVYFSNSRVDKKGWEHFRASLQGLDFYSN